MVQSVAADFLQNLPKSALLQSTDPNAASTSVRDDARVIELGEKRESTHRGVAGPKCAGSDGRHIRKLPLEAITTRMFQATVKLAARTNTVRCRSVELQTIAVAHHSLVALRGGIELSRVGGFRRLATIGFQPRTADESPPVKPICEVPTIGSRHRLLN
jgi:hypothetical protein